MGKNGFFNDSRRGFMAISAGILSSLFIAGPAGARQTKSRLRNFLNAIECDQLKGRFPRRNPLITAKPVDDTTDLYIEGRQNPSLALNPVGTAIWEACDGATSPEHIVSQIETQFAVSHIRAESDCYRFLLLLKSKHLIVF